MENGPDKQTIDLPVYLWRDLMDVWDTLKTNIQDLTAHVQIYIDQLVYVKCCKDQ